MISAGINNAGLTSPNVVIVGWPSGPQSAEIWGKGKSIVSIMPQNARRSANQYRVDNGYLVAPIPPSLVATVAVSSPTLWSITLSGTNAPGLNIWTIVGPTPWADGATLYQTTGAETLDNIAAAIAGQVQDLGVTGVSASATGPTIFVTGATPVWCNVGQPITTTPTGEPIAVVDIGRFDQTVLITIWAPVPDEVVGQTTGNREQLEDAILMSIGGNDQRWNIAPDGSAFSALWGNTGRWSDKAEDAYTVFRSDLELEIEYSLYRLLGGTGNAVTPIGAIGVTLNMNANPPQTEVVGGPISILEGDF